MLMCDTPPNPFDFTFKTIILGTTLHSYLSLCQTETNGIPFNILSAMSSVYQDCKSLSVFYALFMPLFCAVNSLQTRQTKELVWEIFLSSAVLGLVLVPSSLVFWLVLGAVYLVLKQHGHETEYSPPSYPKFDSYWSCNFTISHVFNALVVSSVRDQMALYILGK